MTSAIPNSLERFFPWTQSNHNHTIQGNRNSLEGEEKCACPQDEEEGQIEDALLPGHHDAAITAEGVPAWKFLPFPCHLLSYHHHRHDWNFLVQTGLGDYNVEEMDAEPSFEILVPAIAAAGSNIIKSSLSSPEEKHKNNNNK